MKTKRLPRVDAIQIGSKKIDREEDRRDGGETN